VLTNDIKPIINFKTSKIYVEMLNCKVFDESPT